MSDVLQNCSKKRKELTQFIICKEKDVNVKFAANQINTEGVLCMEGSAKEENVRRENEKVVWK